MHDPEPEAGARNASCLDLATIELIASGGAASDAAQEHLWICDACRATVDDSRHNEQFLTRWRQVQGDGSRVEESSDVPADLIPGYRIIRELSRGSQGVVYEAVQERARRTVALKVLLQGAFATDRQRARFDREIEIVAGLNHPGIVTVYDSTSAKGGRYAYSMQLIEGAEQADVWARRITSRPGDASGHLRRKLAVVARMCDAIHHAHQRGVIHRDLKPGNILIDPGDQPHVLDFGIAKAFNADAASMTEISDVACTPAYAAPEQFSGRPNDIDVRTDVYSLGVILFEMLTDRMPHRFENLSITQVAREVTEKDATRIGSVSSIFSGDLDIIVAKSLEREPARRYQSAEALRQDLLHFLADEPIEAKRDRIGYVLRKSLRNRWREVSVAAVLLLAGVATTITLAASRQRENATRTSEALAHARLHEESARLRAVSLVLGEITPHQRVPDTDPAARYVADGLARLRDRIDLGYFEGEPIAEWAAQSTLGATQHWRRTDQYAEVAYRQALNNAVANVGRDDPRVVQAMCDLADIILARGRTREAEWYARRALNTLDSAGRQDQANRLRALEVLSRILIARGDFVEAESTASAVCMELSGAGEPDRAQMSRAYLIWSLSLQRLGRLHESRDAARKCLVGRLAILPYNDPELAESLARLGDAIRLSNDLTGCEHLARALSLHTPGEVADGLVSMGTILGARYVDMIRIREERAVELDTIRALHQLVAIKRETFGRDSIEMGRTLAELGFRLLYTNDWTASEQALREGTEIYRRLANASSRARAKCLEGFFDVLLHTGKYNEAADVALEAYTIWRRQPAFELDSSSAWNMAREAGRTLCQAGRFAEAADLAGRTAADISRRFGSDTYAAGYLRTIEGFAHASMGKLEMGERLARDGVRVMEADPATPEDQRIHASLYLAAILVPSGSLDEAEARLTSALAYFDGQGNSPGYFYAVQAARLMQRLYEIRGDAVLAAHWRSEVSRREKAAASVQ